MHKESNHQMAISISSLSESVRMAGHRCAIIKQLAKVNDYTAQAWTRTAEKSAKALLVGMLTEGTASQLHRGLKGAKAMTMKRGKCIFVLDEEYELSGQAEFIHFADQTVAPVFLSVGNPPGSPEDLKDNYRVKLAAGAILLESHGHSVRSRGYAIYGVPGPAGANLNLSLQVFEVELQVYRDLIPELITNHGLALHNPAALPFVDGCRDCQNLIQIQEVMAS